MSLQCAYEMFVGDDDTDLVKEASRVLHKKGKMLICPLYMHKEYCYTVSYNLYKKTKFSGDCKEYIRFDYLDVVSRKYSPCKLYERVILPAKKYGLMPKVYHVMNLQDIDERLYLHFILELENE